MQAYFISIAVLAIIIYINATVMIYDYLKKRGEEVSFLFLRLFMISYASKYKEITKTESGKPGYLFNLWIISINLALVCGMVALFIY